MRIPENRIYKVRSTARQAARIADPNLGAGPAALARGMAPAIQGAIAATGQRIRNTLEEARNPHWLTHLKLAQTIARTGAQVSRDLAAAYERRLAHGLEEDQVDYANHMRQFYDAQDADGNLVEGKIRSKWNPDSKEPSGPVKALTDLDAGYDETDHYRGLSAERRARFDQWRSGQREKYANDAIREQQRQMEQHRRDVETKRVNQLAFDVENAMRPDSQNWEDASTAYATEAANKMVPESVRMKEDGTPVDLWTATFQQTKSNLRMKRNALWNSAYELLGENGDDAEKAAKLRAAIDADTEAGGDFLTDEQISAMKAAGEASSMKRIANIEAGYQRAEKDAGIANADWLLSKAGSDGDAERNGADARVNEALARLPDGRREATKEKIVAERDEKAAFDFMKVHANDFFSKAGMDALKNSGLSENAKRIAGKIALKSEDARDKARSDAKNRVNTWIARDGKTAGEIVNLLRGIAESTGDVDTFQYGIEALADEADYLRMFEKQPELRTEYEGIILEGMKEAYGEDIVSLLKFDKNGHIVWDADNRPALADGVTPETMARGLKRGTRQSYMTVPGGQRVTLNNDIFTEISAQTVADTLSLGRKYVMLRHMGNGPDGTTGKPVASEWAKYLKDMLGPDIAKLDDAAIGVTTRRFLEAMPGWVWSDSTAKQESRELLREVRKSNRPTPEEGGNNERK